MKYVFRILLISILPIMMLSCSSNPEKDIIGNWAYPVEYSGDSSMHVLLEFNNNGVVTQSSVIFDNTARGGRLGPKGTYRYSVTDNKLFMDIDGIGKSYSIKFNMTKSKMYMTDNRDGKEATLEKSKL